MPWDDGLDQNSPAYGIAADLSDSIRVVAGPGTGKSFGLKRRVARLLETGVPPTRILPVTFTNVAAEDLQREMLQIGVPGCEAIRGSTLHALGMKILGRRNVLEATGRIARPLNRFEIEPLLYDLSPNFGNKRDRNKRIRAYEAAWARLQHEEPGFAADPDDQLFERVLVNWLRFHRGMLIGEIIPQVYQYLRDNPAAPERHLYDHILVDEYQDLNRAEQAVIDLIRNTASLCIVGDDDQSLYSFKFAHPAGIRTFPDCHPGTTDHEIVDCRRCPTLVVAIANSLIAHNQDREPRQLTPLAVNGPGDIQIRQFETLADEARGIAAFIRDQIDNHGRRPQDILVLAQRRSIGNPIHDALLARDVPSKSYYQEGELDRLTAQERMALFKLFIDPEDRIALRWLLGFQSNDFRTGAYARIRNHCERAGTTPWDVMCQLETGAIRIAHTSHLVDRFRSIQSELADLRGPGVDDEISNLVRRWLPDSIEGLDDLRALVLDLAPTATTPAELLTSLNDAIATPEIPPDVTQVRIMSLHKSKGLSSPVVVIAGCIEGLLPAAPDPDKSPQEQQADLEEQRRLLYVGLTRVKSLPESNQPGVLLLTYSRAMTLADAMQSGITPARVSYGDAYVNASRFIRELGPSAPRPRAA
jgi:DNA helicase II / ATP-dependent DNA helicase PcrA